MKKKAIGMAVALLLVFAVGRAWAEGLSMGTLKEGASVKASYEERDGKKVATSIEVK